MTEDSFNRRDFLKTLGWGGAAVALTGCGNTSIENGKELVTSYSDPQDFVIPSMPVFYNSTCSQCDAGCNIMGRVREGRVLKLEGNPTASLNRGKMCGLGQAGVQAHYNPDRVKSPLLKGQAVTWDQALAAINEKAGAARGDEIAFLTGTVSGHTKVLLNNYLDAVGSKNHYAYDALAPSVARAANKKAYGAEMPRFNIARARVVVSFGADFMGSWVSPVHFATQYAEFRKGTRPEGRGVLVQIEPKMTLTGANADRWIPIRPGTEGILALGIINALGAGVPADAAAAAKGYTPDRVSRDTGVPAEQVTRLADYLKSHSPSLVLAGSAAEGYAHGSENAAAINLLNHALGNVGKTIEAPVGVQYAQLAPTLGSRAALSALNDSLAAGKIKVLFSFGANPVYSAPAAMKFAENLQKVPFKVAFTTQMDETAQAADLVLPLDSYMEEWATSVAEYQAEPQLSIHQPLMERLYPDTRSTGDILLALLKQRRADQYKGYDDYYAYLRAAILQNKAALGAKGVDDDVYWNDTLSNAIVKLPGATANISSHAASVSLPEPAAADSGYPLRLVPGISASLRDGRHANLSWLQESPDPLTTIVWDSWVELHPKTAASLGIVEGDIVEVASKSGSVKAQAYLFPGIHPEAVSVTFGNGHAGMGRYAQGVGVNAFQILDPVTDKETGELAMNETRVKISATGQRVVVVKDEGPYGGSQLGKNKIAVKVSSAKVDLSKEV